MPLQAELAKAVKALWDASSDLTTSVPGGLEYGRVRQGAASPYASLRVKADRSEFTSRGAGGVLQDYLVTIRVWSGEDVADVSPIESQVSAAIDFEVPSVAGAVGAFPLMGDPGSMEEDPETRTAKDVLLTEFNWRARLQE